MNPIAVTRPTELTVAIPTAVLIPLYPERKVEAKETVGAVLNPIPEAANDTEDGFIDVVLPVPTVCKPTVATTACPSGLEKVTVGAERYPEPASVIVVVITAHLRILVLQYLTQDM